MAVVPIVSPRDLHNRMSVPPLPTGRWCFHGVPFEIAPGPGSTPGWGAVAFFRARVRAWAQAAPRCASRETWGRAREVFLLHAGGYQPDETPFARYRIVYQAGGRFRVLP